jgi:hypothetical protein
MWQGHSPALGFFSFAGAPAGATPSRRWAASSNSVQACDSLRQLAGSLQACTLPSPPHLVLALLVDPILLILLLCCLFLCLLRSSGTPLLNSELACAVRPAARELNPGGRMLHRMVGPSGPEVAQRISASTLPGFQLGTSPTKLRYCEKTRSRAKLVCEGSLLAAAAPAPPLPLQLLPLVSKRWAWCV